MESVLPSAYPEPRHSTTTGEDGRFELPQPEEGHTLLYAEAPGFAPAGTLLKEPRSRSIEVSLRRGFPLRGTVEDEGGRPIARAEIRIRRDPHYPPEPHRVPREEAAVLFRFEKRASSDSTGAWETGGIEEGRYILEARGPDLSTAAVSDLEVPHPSPLRIVLHAAAALEGRIRDQETGGPLPHAWIGVQYPPVDRGEAVFEGGPDTRSDAEGRYRLEGLRAGRTASLDVTRQGYATYRSSLTGFDPGEVRTLDVTLSRGCRLFGHVQSEDAKPIAGADVTYATQAAVAWNPGSGTDEEGRFVVPRLASGVPIALRVEAEGYATRELRNVVPPEEDLPVTLQRLSRIEGTVEAEGGPVPSFAVVLSEEGRLVYPAVRRRQVSDPNGTFALDAIAPARYRLRIESQGFAPFVSDAFEVPSGRTTSFRAQLERGSQLRGRVVSRADGRPLPAIRVVPAETRPRGLILGPHGDAAITDRDGEFLLEHAPSGAGTLLFYQSDSLRSLVPYQAAEGETTRLPDVVVGSGAIVEGRVLGPRGKPLGGATVVAKLAWVEAEERARTDAEGGYRLAIGAGMVRIIVMPVEELEGEWQRVWAEEVVDLADGEARRIDFRLEPRGRVFGRVRLQDAPIEAEVTVDLRDPETGRKVVGGCLLASGAEYSLPGVRPGHYHVLCRSLDLSLPFDSMREVAVGEGESVRCDFDLQGSGIEGALRAPGGAALQTPSVLLYPLGRGAPGAIRLPALVERDGSFASVGLSGGRYRLEARAAGCAPAILPSVEVPDDRTVRVEVDLEPEATLSFACRRSDGAPAASLQITLHRSGDPGWPVPASVVTGPDGAASFRGLASGGYEVEVTGEGIFPLREPLALKAGENVRVELAVRRRGNLEILARGGDGSPRAGESISLVDLSTGVDARVWAAAGLVGTSDPALRTDGAGRLALTGLPEGNYRAAAGGVEVAAVVPPGGSGSATITIP